MMRGFLGRRPVFLVLCLGALLCLLPAAFAQAPKPKDLDPDKPAAPASEKELEQKETVNVIERYKWFMKGRQAPAGRTPADMRARAFRQKLGLRQQNLKRWSGQTSLTSQPNGTTFATVPAGGGNPPSLTPAFSNSWTHLGPVPISRENSAYGDVNGRVTAVAIDQTDTSGNTVFVGGAYGGVWKSTNAADANSDNVVWTPLTDSEASLASGAISISPVDHNVILVGTGDPHFAADSYYGLGILRSIDGGSTWTLIDHDAPNTHTFRGMGVAKFAWKPDGSVVVAALSNGSGNDYGLNPGGNQGVYYSTDAGATWTKATNGLSIFGSTTDVVYNTVAAKFFAGLRNQGIFSSTDGATWTRLATQPASFTAGCETGATCTAYRIALATHPTKNELYSLILSSSTTLNRIARSINSGGSWTTLSASGINLCGDTAGCGFEQAFYDLFLGAVPNGTNTDLYVGLVNMFRCSNAATTTCSFTNLTHVYDENPLASHPDYHGFDFLRSTPTTIFWGNDGGLYRSLNGIVGSGATAAQNLNAHLGSFSQFVGMDQHPTDVTVLTGGLQDNGSLDRDSVHFSSISPNTTWWNILFGDGGYAAIDQANPRFFYNEQVYITIQRCDASAPTGNDANGTSGGCIPNAYTDVVCSAQGASYNGCTKNIPDEGQFYTKFILDPANQALLLLGTCKVWRGNADGSGWSSASTANALSNQLSGGSAAACTGSEAAVSALAAGGPSTVNGSQVIYAGLDNGQVWVTTNATTGLATWANRTGLWAARVGDVEIDRSDSTGLTAYVALQGWGINHVYKTTNGGANWTAIGAGLPDVPADAIAVDPRDANVLYVGTDMGVYYTTDGGGTWAQYGPATGAGAFPNSPVTELLIFNSGGTQRLRASTYGRGVWENDLADLGDFTLDVSNPSLTAYPGLTGVFNGTLTATGNYSSPVNLSCSGVSTPTTCSSASSPVTPSGVGTAFTVNAADASPGDYAFSIEGIGADPKTITHEAAVTLHVIDFSLADGTDIVLNASETAQRTLALTLSNWPVGRSVNGSCAIQGGPITGVTCAVAPGSLSGNGNFTLTVNTTVATPVGGFNVDVTATDASDNTQIRTQTIGVTVNPAPASVITVVAPNGGESWMVGTAHAIQWTYSGPVGSTVKIELLKNGLLWSTVSTNAPIGAAGSGSFIWNIPAVLASASDYKIRITSVSNPSALDLSNANFSLIPLVTAITVVSPNGGEAWSVGSTHTIQWTYSGSVGSTVKIELLKNGLLWSTVSTNASVGASGSGSFNWTIPSVLAAASDYRIKVTSTSNTSINDLSDANFSLTPLANTITVISPNGGESWALGSQHAVQWNYSGSVGSTVKIELLKSGVLWSTISASAPVGSGGSGSFNWTIPAVLATASDYTVRVTSTSDTTIKDGSDATFSLVPAANAITVASPNGGESWQLGSVHAVQWTFTGSVGTTVKIELLKSGVLWSTISASAPVGSGGAGSFNWTVPGVLASASDYKVRITSNSDGTIKDLSNANFTLVP